jgi:hypothetical protein
MANFDTPFSTSADFRFPTSDERQNGFACGPADRGLFNGLFHRIEAELREVINYAGLSGTDEDLTQLRQAIVALILAETGGGDPASYLLLSQARTRLPIFPEVQNADGRIVVTSPATGTVRVPGGVSFLHRGIFPVTTSQTDFATTASKTYHLRWNPTDGFALKDLADTGYNPSGYIDGNPLLDSTYDDMLVARVITNASNIATITNLVNRARILMEIANNGAITENPAANASARTANLTFNLARTPIMMIQPTNINVLPGVGAAGTFSGSAAHDHDFQITRTSFNRYGASVILLRDYSDRFDILATVQA